LWNSIFGVTFVSHVLEIGIFIGTICCLTSIILLQRSDRQMAELRSDNFNSSSKRLKSIESVAGDIRKELLDVQQERDILLEKLKVREEEYHKLHLALDEAVKKNSDLRHSVNESSLKGTTNRKTKQESEVGVEPKSPMSRDQREQLTALLDPGPKGDIDILSVIGDDTSSLLANELNEIFKADGWTTKGVAQSAFSKVPEGIVLSVHSKETAPSYASFIQRTMATIGFSVSAAVNNKYREWSLTLIVGKVL
jgi:hypothetical protein